MDNPPAHRPYGAVDGPLRGFEGLPTGSPRPLPYGPDAAPEGPCPMSIENLNPTPKQGPQAPHFARVGPTASGAGQTAPRPPRAVYGPYAAPVVQLGR